MRETERLPRTGEAGFTVVEGLVAALILAIILIGILPMVTRSMQNNLQGGDATHEANAVTDKTEELLALQFNHSSVTVPDGLPSLVSTSYFSLANNTWSATSGGSDDQFTRTLTVEQFSGDDLATDGTLDSPIMGSLTKETLQATQLKRLTFEITKRRALGASPYRVVVLKAY